jgi:hypothetical protein
MDPDDLDTAEVSLPMNSAFRSRVPNNHEIVARHPRDLVVVDGRSKSAG